MMMQPATGFRQEIAFEELLNAEEIILIVDDDPDISEPLAEYLEESGFTTAVAATAKEMREILKKRNVALVLLDIGLPDADGVTLIPNLIHHHADTAIIMLSGIADIHVAIDCIRKGADDYLAKPVKFNEIFIVIKKVLEKRRLVFDNRQYQQDLEQANFRFKLLHQLSLKINSIYLDTTELDRLLHAILVGITANEGLRFNRAFLALLDEDQHILQGQLAIGPDCREQAAAIWADIKEKELNFSALLGNMEECSCGDSENSIKDIVKRLTFPTADKENIFIRCAEQRRSFVVKKGVCDIPVPQEIIDLLDEDSFVVVPLFSPSRPLGVIIADHYVTKQPIDANNVTMLELFANQVSVAIEHSQLYRNMQQKISELEQVTHELDQNKDLLVAAERYSALGQMAAQMMHVLRNPITSIGGISRILSKKIDNQVYGKYLDVMIKETSRLEETLGDLFDFVSRAKPEKEVAEIYPLLGKTLRLMQPTMLKQNIDWNLELDEATPYVNMDVRQMRQMLLHITRNSIEAMEEEGKLSVRGFVEDKWVHIHILDSGRGMSKANIIRAREPFFTTKTYGSGMGLAMVERIIANHDGTFSLQRSDAGMLAQLKLPIQEAGERRQNIEDRRQEVT